LGYVNHFTPAQFAAPQEKSDEDSFKRRDDDDRSPFGQIRERKSQSEREWPGWIFVNIICQYG
jgi:hypothetical protein